MRIPLTARCLTLALMLSLTALALGQTPTSDESKIRTLRANIALMMGNAPPAGAGEEGDYRKNLQSLRIQLRDLLIEKRGGLKVRIQNLRTPDALPEVLAHAEQLEQQLGSVNDELQGLDRNLGQAAGLPPAPMPIKTPEPVPVVTPPDAEKETAKAEKVAKKEAILAATSKITAEDLKKAAAPKEVQKPNFRQ